MSPRNRSVPSTLTDRSSRLGVVRLELFGRLGRTLRSQSSFCGWLTAVAELVPELALVCRTRTDVSLNEHDRDRLDRYSFRERDRLFSLPDLKGYLGIFLGLPLLVFRLVQLRLWCSVVLCRAPEHGNLFVLPLALLLRFRCVVWLVNDRTEVAATEIQARGSRPRRVIGRALSRITGRVERWALGRCQVIANGAALDRLAAAAGCPSSDILQVVSTTLPRATAATAGARTEVRGDSLVMLYVGRVAPEKGLTDLIDALAILNTQGVEPPIHLRVVGWSSLQEGPRLRERARQRGVDDLVEFVGPVAFGPDLFAHYNAADLFVLPSHAEGTPRVLPEAMAFGLPIVATRVGGVPDAVEHVRNGILVPARDPAALAEAISRMGRDAELRCAMGRANRETAARFTVEALAGRMLDFIFRRGGSESCGRSSRTAERHLGVGAWDAS